MSTLSKFKGIVVCTKAQYEALSEKNPEKMYLITDEPNDELLTKTLFGKHSIWGSGNIDLYEHDMVLTKENGMAYITIYSSNNTKIDSLTNLKLVAGNTFVKPCTGYIGSKLVVAITETSLLLSDGSSELLTNTTFTDTVMTI